jgi:nucleoside-diphosphate-sugar epimerase
MRIVIAALVLVLVLLLGGAPRSAFARTALPRGQVIALGQRTAFGPRAIALSDPAAYAPHYADFAPVKPADPSGAGERLPLLTAAFLGSTAAAVSMCRSKEMQSTTTSRIAALPGQAVFEKSRISAPVRMQLAKSSKRLLVIGGNGFVGREVCRYAVQNGFVVTSLSRRGQCPDTNDEILAQVDWQAGNALDQATINKYVGAADAVVHAIGLLFDVDSGLKQLNFFTSASKSTPDADSTYDNITRKTALMVIHALNSRLRLPGSGRTPVAFVSCAEAGWPDVKFGEAVEKSSPDWLKRYLVAKRAVEEKLTLSKDLRSIIVRPSLIWNWTKFDVLPIIPIFNIANALGVPFVDKTVRVETVGASIVSALLNEGIEGVQRFDKMEQLAKDLD